MNLLKRFIEFIRFDSSKPRVFMIRDEETGEEIWRCVSILNCRYILGTGSTPIDAIRDWHLNLKG